ncbi:MAG TPA: RDD family protein [Verrucomicrobiae bacterium]|nr:RDD family protein [Verrucomicrobiae bacterium]
MNWYYVAGGQQAGPVDEAQLDQLVQSGQVQPETLVWHEGLPNWLPYREARPESVPAGAPAAAPAGLRLEATPQPGPNEAVCAECGKTFNVQDMIPYGAIRVCASCKPILMQKLAEGARLNTGQLNYAGFWTRFAAIFLDGIILWVFNTLLNVSFGFGMFRTANPGGPGASLPVAFFVVIFLELFVALSYEVVMIGKFGATLGKMACKIKVVTAEGGRVSYLRSLGRYFAKMLSGAICAIGYIMAGFDEQKRALHDRICNTRVVLR